jgi:hypothetical protein
MAHPNFQVTLSTSRVPLTQNLAPVPGNACICSHRMCREQVGHQLQDCVQVQSWKYAVMDMR